MGYIPTSCGAADLGARHGRFKPTQSSSRSFIRAAPDSTSAVEFASSTTRAWPSPCCPWAPRVEPRPPRTCHAKTVQVGKRPRRLHSHVLPADGPLLRSLDLISITLGSSAWVPMVELWGKSCKDNPFIGEKQSCCVCYSARCVKKDTPNAALPDNLGGRSADAVELGKGEMTAI